MADKWTWYRAALDAAVNGREVPVNANKPEWGFYFAKASKAGGRIPVCIYADGNGELVARWGTRDEHLFEDATKRWTWVAANPVDRGTYTHAWSNGAWPDGTPTTAADAPPAMGDNAPTDPFERLQAELADKMASATAFLGDAVARMDKTRADRARNLQAELLALNKAADKMHEDEKRPHLEASRAVDAKFRFRDGIKDVCGKLRTVFENILRAEEAKAREEARKKHEAEVRAAEAERQRISAEHEKKMANDPIAALTDPEPELPIVPSAPEPVKVQAGGGIGRAAGLKTVWEPRIDDWKAAAAQFVAQDDPDIRAAVEKKIKALARINKEATKISGVTMVQDRRAA